MRHGGRLRANEDQNDPSVATRLNFGRTAFLFMGDLEEDVHQAMVGFFCDKPAASCALNTDVYHVAHHGSYNGTSPALPTADKNRALHVDVEGTP